MSRIIEMKRYWIYRIHVFATTIYHIYEVVEKNNIISLKNVFCDGLNIFSGYGELILSNIILIGDSICNNSKR